MSNSPREIIYHPTCPTLRASPCPVCKNASGSVGYLSGGVTQHNSSYLSRVSGGCRVCRVGCSVSL